MSIIYVFANHAPIPCIIFMSTINGNIFTRVTESFGHVAGRCVDLWKSFKGQDGTLV